MRFTARTKTRMGRTPQLLLWGWAWACQYTEMMQASPCTDTHTLQPLTGCWGPTPGHARRRCPWTCRCRLLLLPRPPPWCYSAAELGERQVIDGAATIADDDDECTRQQAPGRPPVIGLRFIGR